MITVYKDGTGIPEVIKELQKGERELKKEEKRTVKKLRHSEMFYSIQGEGRFVGTPSVFLRLYGCNFECPGFGQPRGQLIPRDEMPWKNLDVSQYKSIEELPVMKIGCDSSASWAKEYMHLSTFEEADIIAEKLTNLCPDKKWFYEENYQDIHLVITGGEPMMWQKQLPDLLGHESLRHIKNITFETNSTFALTDKFHLWLHEFSLKDHHITWSCSPKLSISGELGFKAIKPENWRQYKKVQNSHLYLKFVVQDEQDIEEIKQIEYVYDRWEDYHDIYLMPCGGTAEMLENTKFNVAEMAMKHGFKYSPRLHVDLFGNKWGT